MENNVPQEWNKFYLKDVSFVNLMMRRIYNVLIVANPYDAFMLEDDGRIEEKIYNEYMELGLRYPQPSPKSQPPKRQPRCSAPPSSTSSSVCRAMPTTMPSMWRVISKASSRISTAWYSPRSPTASPSEWRTKTSASSITFSAGWATPTSSSPSSSSLRIR